MQGGNPTIVSNRCRPQMRGSNDDNDKPIDVEVAKDALSKFSESEVCIVKCLYAACLGRGLTFRCSAFNFKRRRDSGGWSRRSTLRACKLAFASHRISVLTKPEMIQR